MEFIIINIKNLSDDVTEELYDYLEGSDLKHYATIELPDPKPENYDVESYIKQM